MKFIRPKTFPRRVDASLFIFYSVPDTLTEKPRVSHTGNNRPIETSDYERWMRRAKGGSARGAEMKNRL